MKSSSSTLTWPCEVPLEEAPPESRLTETSSIQLNLARLGIEGLSAAELANLIGMQMLLATTFFRGATVIQLGRLVANLIDDKTSSNDFWGGGEDILGGCARPWDSELLSCAKPATMEYAYPCLGPSCCLI